MTASTSATSSTCPAGATLVLYTDGLIEDRDARRSTSGLEQLRGALDGVRLPPDAVCDHVLRALGAGRRAARTTSRCSS